MKEPLKGWKTYIGMIVIGAVSIALKAEWITLDTYGWIMGVVVPMTGVTMRMGMKK